MTSTFEHGGMMACPACVGTPDNVIGSDADAPKSASLLLALPHIHCAACISGVERALMAVEGVTFARVNLTMRRVAVDARPDIEPDALIQCLARAGFEAQELDSALLASGGQDDYGRMLLMRVGVAGFAMMNVMLLSVAVWSGADAATRDMMHWISAAIALPAVAFAGMPFYTSALTALRAGRLNMDVPITLAIVLAAGTSLYETFHSGHHAYFDAAIALAFFLLTGRYLEHRTRSSARSAAQELAALEVRKAIRLENGVEQTVSVQDLVVGDRIVVRAGANIPADGRVLNGQSELDRSFMTGETIPAFVSSGNAVHAGEINLSAVLEVEVTATGADTELRRIADAVALAETGRNKYSSLADRAVQLYAPGVHILALVAAIGWYLYTQDLRVSFNIAAAVLIITCPCALGLAVPAVSTAVSGRLYKKGLLVKHETALERLSEIDTVVFDKTGTVTEGQPSPASLEALSPDMRAAALALALRSDHPLSVSLAKALVASGTQMSELTDIREFPGLGMEGWSGSQRVRLGRSAWVGGPDLDQAAVCLQVGDQAPIVVPFMEHIRDGAETCVQQMQAAGLQVILLSGDAAGAVAAVARQLAITEYHSEQMPQQKAAFIRDLQDKGRRVLMVGDGLNDTSALTTAHVSLSPASALNAARAASDFVLISKSLAEVPPALGLAKQAKARILENLSIASIYNVIAVPLAIAGMATPLIAALAMSASSLTVTLNAIRLRS